MRVSPVPRGSTQPHLSAGLVDRLSTTTPGQPSNQQEVVHELRRVILAGDAPPGTAIPLDEVAKFFDCSLIPVRESLKTLIGEGLVDHEPRGGYRVARLTQEELREFYVIREVLEAAALRASIVNATEEDDAAVAEIHEALGAAIAAGDSRAYHRDSRLFHIALVSPSGMHRLLHMFEMAWNVTEPARPLESAPDAEREQMYADHAAMLEAFRARDAEELVRRSQDHYHRLEHAVDGR